MFGIFFIRFLNVWRLDHQKTIGKNGGKNSKMASPFKKIIIKCKIFVLELGLPLCFLKMSRTSRNFFKGHSTLPPLSFHRFRPVTYYTTKILPGNASTDGISTGLDDVDSWIVSFSFLKYYIRGFVAFQSYIFQILNFNEDLNP